MPYSGPWLATTGLTQTPQIWPLSGGGSGIKTLTCPCFVSVP